MNRLKELRTQRELSIRELAEKVGISHTNITHLENGKRNFTAKNAQKLADFFGVSIDYLLGRDMSPKNTPPVDITAKTIKLDKRKLTMKLSGGYIAVYMPESGMATKNGWVLLHRAVMAAAIGRDLTPEEVVHHIDGNPSNNALSNLMLFPNNAEHRRYHAQQRREKLIADLLKQ